MFHYLQHPRCEVNAHDKDGNTASQHARYVMVPGLMAMLVLMLLVLVLMLMLMLVLMSMLMLMLLRTPSVKWRLHNYAHRSRSMETVLCTERFHHNRSQITD